MRGAWWVIGTCLALSVAGALVLKSRYRGELVEVQDLLTGLLYFMEDHGGRFPTSQEEFLSSRAVESQAGGGIRIIPRGDSRYRQTTHGAVIGDLASFKVAWGIDLTTLSVNERGRVVDPDGREVTLMVWPSSPPSSREYAKVLLAAHAALRAMPPSSGAEAPQASSPGASSAPGAP